MFIRDPCLYSNLFSFIISDFSGFFPSTLLMWFCWSWLQSCSRWQMLTSRFIPQCTFPLSSSLHLEPNLMNGRLGVFQMELALTGCCFTVAHFLYVVLGLFVLIFVVMVTSGCCYDLGTELPKYADLKHGTTGNWNPVLLREVNMRHNLLHKAWINQGFPFRCEVGGANRGQCKWNPI